jgi:hypothetical protein
MSDSRPCATPVEVQAAIASIRQYHEEGRRILQDVSMQGSYGQGSIQAQAERRGWNPTKARKARQFAEPTTGYSPDRLNELCRLIRGYRPHFGISHVGILLTVPWPERAELQKQCMAEYWSKSELEAEIKRLYGSRRQGGRRRHVPDRDHALVQLDEMADSWQRWYRVATEERNGQDRPWTLLGTLPVNVQNGVQTVSRSMGLLKEAVAGELAASRRRLVME